MHTISLEKPLHAIALKKESIAKLHSRTAKIGVIGLGYVGLPIAFLLTE